MHCSCRRTFLSSAFAIRSLNGIYPPRHISANGSAKKKILTTGKYLVFWLRGIFRCLLRAVLVLFVYGAAQLVDEARQLPTVHFGTCFFSDGAPVVCVVGRGHFQPPL